MKAKQSSARLTFQKFIRIGALVLLVVMLGAGLAVVAGLFVLGDLSGAWQTGKVAPNRPPGEKLIAARYVDPAPGAANPRAVIASSNSHASQVPPPLVATPAMDNSPAVPVARAIPVLPDVPVLRARPVLIAAPRTFDAAPRTFDARAALADDQDVPRARAVSRSQASAPPARPYELPSSRRVAQREPVALDW